MFPFDVDIEDEEEVIEEESNLNTDYEIDFNTGRLTGRIITGLAAVVQWARLTLATERYFYSQYSWDYGSELQNLIGKNHSKDYIESEVKRILNEALLINEAIKGIEDLKCGSNGEKLKISFGLETIYGRGDIYV